MLIWKPNPDHPAFEFRVEILSEQGYPLFLKGSYNPLIPMCSYVIIHRQGGRIYALDVGKAHRNPSGQHIGETHKHRWTERFGDREAYEPTDITVGAEAPLLLWQQFCQEANLSHNGMLSEPPPWQEELF